MARLQLIQLFLTVACIALVQFPNSARAQKIPTIPKWQRFEATLKSNVTYTNALQEAEVRALFVSPLGETNRVYGFWDGGKTWRIRYQPNFPGRWTYYTMCSDTANRGLHEQSGEFLCTATKGESRFEQHGPVQVARNHQHLEHADRTPFLWLGDAAWFAALRSTPDDWQQYVETRALQKFNVVQWRLHPGSRTEKQSAFTGHDRISVNLDFFRQLDAKVIAANRAGLLSAIAPLWEISDSMDAPLPEDQAILLLRYALARWGAEHVAWIVAFESDSTGAQATRWQNIGRAVFNYVSHAPVILLPGESVWALDAFRRERWVDVLGVQTAMVSDENSLPWLLNGPLALERHKTPARPLISIAPPVEVVGVPSAGQVTSNFARRLMWWSVMLNTPAGVSYAAKDVAAWTRTPDSAATEQPWQIALALPGAEAVAPLASRVRGKDFWQLEPFSQALLQQPGIKSPPEHIAALRATSQDIFMFYTPEARTVSVSHQTVSARVQATWFDPRNGTSRPTINTSPSGESQLFTPPTPGDWLLVLNKAPEPERTPKTVKR